MSSKRARGTKSLIFGERPSVRLPRRIVPICVREPTGTAFFLRTSSTPAMKVVATAPIPGRRIPSFPFGAAIFVGFSMKFLSFPIGGRCRPQIPHKNAASQTIHDEGSGEDMQMGKGREKIRGGAEIVKARESRDAGNNPGG